jgi:gamma-glutamyltranspeptidase/glutathione hydrolase
MPYRPELRGAHTAVSSTHWLASAAGQSMFELGGNAFDAATAVGFVLQVVEPHLNGPAGDVPIMVRDGATGQVEVICGQGPMPQGATIAAMRAAGVTEVPASGLLPACVPGAFGAFLTLLRDRGTLRLAEVLEPAIGYAEDGYPILPQAAAMIDSLAELFRDEWTESGATYLVHGNAPAPYSRVQNPVLAGVYRRILAEANAASGGREAQIDAAIACFYEGFVAEAIHDFTSTATPIDSTGQRHGGLLTGDDLAGWRPGVEEPVSLDYRGLRVHKCGPWSQGPVFLQQLGLLEGTDFSGLEFGGADHLHLVTEAAKLAFADREAWYGDPAVVDVPLKALLDPAYAAERRQLIGPRASGQLRPGRPDDAEPFLPPAPDSTLKPRSPGWLTQIEDGVPAVVKLTAASGDTCCLSATDAAGNMVVATPSGGWLKSSPVVPGLGFALGTRGQMALMVEGHPNSLAPGKRPRTTLSPTIVTRGGEPYLAFGTPGGDQQDQWTLNFFLNHVEFGMSPQAAIEARTFFTDAVPTSFAPRHARPRTVVLEKGASEATLAELRSRGHEVEEAPALSQGKVCATGVDEAGFLLAAASPRGGQAYGLVR